MLKNRCKLMLIIALIMILGINVVSFSASNTCTVSLDLDKTQVKRGETVTILIKASNIQGEGIVGFNAMVNYDSNLFECTASGDESGTWIMQGFIENNLTTTRADLEANTENQTIGKLVLKAKTDATIGKEEIKLSDIEFITGENSFTIDSVTATISIISESQNEEDNFNTNTNITGETNTNDNNEKINTNTSNAASTNTKQQSTSSNTDTSTSYKSMPKTGITSGLIIGAIIVGVIASIVFYIKYKRAY